MEEGWKLLPQYRFNNETGEWRHRTNSVFRDRRWLGHVSFTSGQMTFTSNPLSQGGQPEASAEECLAVARDILSQAGKLAARETVPDQTVAFPEEVSRLRWFLTPYEAKCCLSGDPLPAVSVPFSPPSLLIPKPVCLLTLHVPPTSASLLPYTFHGVLPFPFHIPLSPAALSEL